MAGVETHAAGMNSAREGRGWTIPLPLSPASLRVVANLPDAVPGVAVRVRASIAGEQNSQ